MRTWQNQDKNLQASYFHILHRRPPSTHTLHPLHRVCKHTILQPNHSFICCSCMHYSHARSYRDDDQCGHFVTLRPAFCLIFDSLEPVHRHPVWFTLTRHQQLSLNRKCSDLQADLTLRRGSHCIQSWLTRDQVAMGPIFASSIQQQPQTRNPWFISTNIVGNKQIGREIARHNTSPSALWPSSFCCTNYLDSWKGNQTLKIQPCWSTNRTSGCMKLMNKTTKTLYTSIKDHGSFVGDGV